jgi:thiol-disulfide isomerase/thioredoxin
MKRKLLCCLALALSVSLPPAAAAGPVAEKVAGKVAGQVADDVPVLPAGQFERLLAASAGKVVLINFFASWCPPCREELPGLMRLRQRYHSDQVVFVGLSVDQSMSDLKKFLAGTPLNYPVYIADARIARAYGVYSIPHNALYDKAGDLVWNNAGLLEERDLRRILDSLLKE